MIPQRLHPTTNQEYYGKEASNYTCEKIKKAKKIILEFDENSEEKDKYDRYLVWVFIDGKLLQNQLVELGYAKVAYLYGDYKYTEILQTAQEKAKKNKVGLWSNHTDEKNNKYILIATIIILIILFFNKNSRKKIVNKTKIKKELKKLIK